MAALERSTNFPAELAREMFNKVKGHSSIARLSGQTPMTFSGTEIMTFSLDHEVAIVGEGAAKPAGDATVGTVTIVPVKVVYQSRVNDEFVKCAEEKQLRYLEAFTEGYARKIARGLDIMAFHGINPYSGTTSSLIGTNSLDSNASVVSTTYSSSAEASIGAAITGLGDNDVNGIAMSKNFAALLAATTYAGGVSPYEAFMWGGNPGAVRGIPADVNSTVSVSATTAVVRHAYVGDFQNAFKWGYAENIPLEVIEYGNPDGGTYDLKQANQVLLRAEAYLGWGILDGAAFARIVAAG